MTYLQLSLCFLLLAVVAALGVTIAFRRRGAHPAAVALTIVALFTLTAVFDTVMIATGLFHYSPDHLLGWHIGLAPVEDFAYPLAGALLLPALWAALRTRKAAPDRHVDGEREERT